jgi:hypothetical protein
MLSPFMDGRDNGMNWLETIKLQSASGIQSITERELHGLANEVKLPAYTAGLPGKVISFYIVPLDPAYLPTRGQETRGLRGTFRSEIALTIEDR